MGKKNYVNRPLLTLVAIFIFYKLFTINSNLLVPLSMIVMIAGLFWEYRKVMGSWKAVFGMAVSAFVFSLFMLFPGKRERNYSFNEHIHFWPFYYCFFFIAIALLLDKKKFVPRMNEGMTVLQSVGMIYLLVTAFGFAPESHFKQALFVVAGLFSFFSLIHALTYFTLSKVSQFILSLWSSIIMIVFSVYNMVMLFKSPDVTQASSWAAIAVHFSQYFLLGVSSIYIINNVILLFGYFPLPGLLAKGTYLKECGKLTDIHLERYSDHQTTKTQSLLILVLSVGIFGANYFYHFVPMSFLIWVMFVAYQGYLSYRDLHHQNP